MVLLLRALQARPRTRPGRSLYAKNNPSEISLSSTTLFRWLLLPRLASVEAPDQDGGLGVPQLVHGQPRVVVVAGRSHRLGKTRVFLPVRASRRRHPFGCSPASCSTHLGCFSSWLYAPVKATAGPLRLDLFYVQVVQDEGGKTRWCCRELLRPKRLWYAHDIAEINSCPSILTYITPAPRPPLYPALLCSPPALQRFRRINTSQTCCRT